MHSIDAPASRLDRSLGLAAFILVAVWGFLTVAYGAADLITSVRNWWSFQHPGTPVPGAWLGGGFGLVLMIGWVTSLNAVPVALVLGIVQIARADGGVWRCLTFAVVLVGSVVAAFAFNQTRNGDDAGIATSLWSWEVLGALFYPILVVATLVASWLLLRPGRQPVAPA